MTLTVIKRSAYVCTLVILISAVVAFRRNAASSFTFEWVSTAYGDVNHRVYLNGLVFPKDRVVVNPLVTGRVVRVFVAEGEHVAAGQALFELDAVEPSYQLSRRKLELARLLVRTDEPSASADTTLRQLEIQGAELEVARAQRTVRACTMRSPLGGTVIHCGVHEGDVVGAGSPTSAVVIADSSRTTVQVEGDEFEMTGINVGDTASVSIPSLRGDAIPASVIRRPTLRRLSTSALSPSFYGFDVELTNPVNAYYGASATVELNPTARLHVLTIPVNAVVTTSDGDWVVVKHGVEFRAVRVKLGVSNAQVVEVLDGVRPGEEVGISDIGAMRALVGGSR